MSNITGFKSTDIELYSKVEPTTVTRFGYKRSGTDVNAMVALASVATATTLANTTESVVVMAPSATVREGDILEYNGIRSEITSVSAPNYTLGRSITSLAEGLSVTIYRPTYLSTNASGEILSSVSPVIETVTGTLGALNGEVTVDNPRFLKIEIWGTANQTISFYERLDTPTGTADKPATGTMVGTTGIVASPISSALAFSGTNVEAFAQFSPVAAQRFIVRATGYISGTANVRITNLNWPVEARNFSELDGIRNGVLYPQFTDLGIGYIGVMVGGFDEDSISQAAFKLKQSTPVGTESGLITRNIPSGTQDGNVKQWNGTTVDTNSGNKSAGTLRVVLATDQPALSNSLLVTSTISTSSRTAVARGKLAGSSLTTSYQTVLTMGGAGKILHLYNGTEVPVIISFDGGTTDDWELDPYESAAIDYASNGHTLASGTIQAKLVSGSAATNGGSVRAMVTR